MPDAHTVQTISYEGAARVVAAAVDHAAAHGFAMNIAVSDAAGNLVAFARMDGAPLLSSAIAQDKAYTVAAFNGIPTHAWFGMIQGDPALAQGILHRPRLVVFGGGVPLRAGGEAGGALIGAIGVSGGSAEQDREVAEAGAAALTR